MEAGSTAPSAGGFAAVLEQLTEQLRREHHREVSELKVKIRQLTFQLHSHQSKTIDCDERLSAVSKIEWPAPRPAKVSEASAVSAVSTVSKFEWQSPVRLGKSTAEAAELPGGTGEAGGDARRENSRVRMWMRKITGPHVQQKGLVFSKEGSRATCQEGEGPPDDAGLLERIKRLVQSDAFEATFSFLIAFNALLMAFEAQYYSVSVGVSLGYLPADTVTDLAWAEAIFTFFGWFFGICFAVEIILRLVGLRARFACDLWNWLDLAIVLLWVVGRLEDNIPVNPQLIRLARLAKLIRLVRLVKRLQGLDALFLMTTSLKGSASILAWTCVLLFVVLLLNALLLNQVLGEFYLTNERFPESERKEVYRYFGSFTTSIFSMFELTLANWAPISRKLYENVSEWFIVITIFHKLVIGFAVVGVINGVFMQETFEVAHHDDEIMLRRGRHAALVHAEKMRRLVATTDNTGNSELDRAAFRGIFDDPGLKAWLATMDLVPLQPDVLFEMMADGKSVVTVDDLIRGMAAYKGTAKNLDLHTLMHEHRRLQATVDRRLPGPGQPTAAEL